MKVVVDVGIIPIGVGTSLSEYVAACQRVFIEAGLEPRLHAYGTNLEGEWDAVFGAIHRCHEVLHGMGAPRLATVIKVGTRVDREQGLDDKIESVRRKLAGS